MSYAPHRSQGYIYMCASVIDFLSASVTIKSTFASNSAFLARMHETSRCSYKPDVEAFKTVRRSIQYSILLLNVSDPCLVHFKLVLQSKKFTVCKCLTDTSPHFVLDHGLSLPIQSNLPTFKTTLLTFFSFFLVLRPCCRREKQHVKIYRRRNNIEIEGKLQ